MSESDATPHPGAAFLLAQLGAHAAARFAERIADLDLTPPLAGVLRLVAREPALSQRQLAHRLGAAPSRIVALVDDLEHRALLARIRSADDRRVYELHLTSAGRRVMGTLSDYARAHDQEVTAELEPAERRELGRLLAKLADAHGLTPGVHPGYRDM